MNNERIEENIEALKKTLKYHGFGDSLNEVVKTSLMHQRGDFQTPITGQFGKDKVDFNLNFGYSEKKDWTYLNSHTATLKSDNEEKNGRSQTFFMKNNSTNTHDAHALLNGRPVYKSQTTAENEKYQAWVGIDYDSKKDKYGNHDLRRYGEEKGSRLEGAFAKHPEIIELRTEKGRAEISELLRTGKQASVTVELPGGARESRVIEMNAKYKNLDFIGSDGNKLFQSKTMQVVAPENSQKQESAQSQNRDIKPSATNSPSTEKANAQANEEGEKKSKNKGMRV